MKKLKVIFIVLGRGKTGRAKTGKLRGSFFNRASQQVVKQLCKDFFTRQKVEKSQKEFEKRLRNEIINLPSADTGFLELETPVDFDYELLIVNLTVLRAIKYLSPIKVVKEFIEKTKIEPKYKNIEFFSQPDNPYLKLYFN